MSTIYGEGFVADIFAGETSGSVTEITPPVGAESTAIVRNLCRRSLTRVSVRDFATFSAYVERVKEIEFELDAELVANAIAALGPLEAPDMAGGIAHPDDPTAMLIPLCNGGFTVIDADDYPLVKRHQWYSHLGYARTSPYHLGKTVHLHMHRLVMMLNADNPSDVDHINGDGLDTGCDDLRDIALARMNQRDAARRLLSHEWQQAREEAVLGACGAAWFIDQGDAARERIASNEGAA